MSVLHEILLVCTDDDCVEIVRAGVVVDAPLRRGHVRAARRHARTQHGWRSRRLGGRMVDLCPRHAPLELG